MQNAIHALLTDAVTSYMVADGGYNFTDDDVAQAITFITQVVEDPADADQDRISNEVYAKLLEVVDYAVTQVGNYLATGFDPA